MTLQVELSAMPDPALRPFEICERKGIGHPDTICDALAEGLSVALSRFYVERFGRILHHNVDKVLLCAGAARPRFGGGEVTRPIEIFFAGRATLSVKGVEVPLESLAAEVSREFFRKHFHLLDPDRHLRLHCRVRPGSDELVELFLRPPPAGVALANDSSIGVGFAPLSAVERRLLAIDEALRRPQLRFEQPAFGEDSKLLAVRRGSDVAMTVACAFCDRYVADPADYLAKKALLAGVVERAGGDRAELTVNAADDPDAGSIYLTVTGTSAEAGDDGEAGRGNRANGLISPGRPMSIECVAGKNPVSHVGKLYNLAARAIAEDLVKSLPQAAAAECFLVSRIGRPISEPQLAHVRMATRDGTPVAALDAAVDGIVRAHLLQLGGLWHALLSGQFAVF